MTQRDASPALSVAATRRTFIERLAATTALPVVLPLLLSQPFPARADY